MRFVKNATAAMNKATFTCGSQATYIVSHHFYLYIFERIQYRGSPISYIYSLAYIDLYIYIYKSYILCISEHMHVDTLCPELPRCSSACAVEAKTR